MGLAGVSIYMQDPQDLQDLQNKQIEELKEKLQELNNNNNKVIFDEYTEVEPLEKP